MASLGSTLALAPAAFAAYAPELFGVLACSRSLAHSPKVLRLFSKTHFGQTGRTLLSIASLHPTWGPRRAAELLAAEALPMRTGLADLAAAQKALRAALDLFNAAERKSASKEGSPALDFYNPHCCNLSNFYPWDDLGPEGEAIHTHFKGMLRTCRRLGLDMQEFGDWQPLQADALEDSPARLAEIAGDFDMGVMDLPPLSDYSEGRKPIVFLATCPLPALIEAFRKGRTWEEPGGALEKQEKAAEKKYKKWP
jgi:hypothetical protein